MTVRGLFGNAKDNVCSNGNDKMGLAHFLPPLHFNPVGRFQEIFIFMFHGEIRHGVVSEWSKKEIIFILFKLNFVSLSTVVIPWYVQIKMQSRNAEAPSNQTFVFHKKSFRVPKFISEQDPIWFGSIYVRRKEDQIREKSFWFCIVFMKHHI